MNLRWAAVAVSRGESLCGVVAVISAGEGDVYSEDEIRDMLAATGWVMSGRRPLTGPASLVVAERQ